MANSNNKVTEDAFKKVLGGYITGVTVVTTVDDQGKEHGFTANSFNSVSLNPPLVSFCLHNNSSTLPHLLNNNKCTVNILSAEQEQLAKHFAFFRGDKFIDIDYVPSQLLQCPAMNNSLGWLECEVVNTYPAGDHLIFVCRVINLERDDTKKPLIYYSGNYNQF